MNSSNLLIPEFCLIAVHFFVVLSLTHQSSYQRLSHKRISYDFEINFNVANIINFFNEKSRSFFQPLLISSPFSKLILVFSSRQKRITYKNPMGYLDFFDAQKQNNVTVKFSDTKIG
ncbi:hypothetical protein BpHYR1_037637 [Brachionus plicatilis]|uniref:Uncharacterized protein n=1 Tax=Brachionus plicatilis TaxID=10195 RepID=A0A3M7P9J0_BRAPC|nr:hypothetical protein BpHYR1_037637 [Brachionus plicatilis]